MDRIGKLISKFTEGRKQLRRVEEKGEGKKRSGENGMLLAKKILLLIVVRSDNCQRGYLVYVIRGYAMPSPPPLPCHTLFRVNYR